MFDRASYELVDVLPVANVGRDEDRLAASADDRGFSGLAARFRKLADTDGGAFAGVSLRNGQPISRTRTSDNRNMPIQPAHAGRC